jgi:4-diphosphocytidyl-2-C-methyl-D-erythritol kinase
MVVFPNAKINLGLNVTEKRPDGYHNLETVFFPIPLLDILELEKNELNQTRFTCSGIEIPNDGKDNLVVRTFKKIQDKFDLPHVDIHLHKNIPTGAGLGGGSADAAFMINLCAAYFNLEYPENYAFDLAKSIGADCPFFLYNQACFAQGIGDEISPISFNLKNYYLVLVYPNIHVSTALAYQGIVPQKKGINLPSELSKDIIQWKNFVVNDFEKSVFNQFPVIADVKEQLYNQGALYASMSGSGAAVFGIFNQEPDFKTKHQNWIFKL